MDMATLVPFYRCGIFIDIISPFISFYACGV